MKTISLQKKKNENIQQIINVDDEAGNFNLGNLMIFILRNI